MADSKRWVIHLVAIIIGIGVVIGVISLRSSRKSTQQVVRFEEGVGIDKQAEEIASGIIEATSIPEPNQVPAVSPVVAASSDEDKDPAIEKRLEELRIPFYKVMRENQKRMKTVLSLYQKASGILAKQGKVGEQALAAAKKKTLDPPVLEMIKTIPQISDDHDELFSLSKEAKEINAKFNRIANYIEKYYDDYETNPDEIAKELEKQIQEFDQLLKVADGKG